MKWYDLVIIGAGAAGISAAKAARGAEILLVDRRDGPGGVLRQCAHRGFGRNRTGPEYIEELMDGFPRAISAAWNTTALGVSPERKVLLWGKDTGRREAGFSQLILASGCREIPFGALGIAGTRSAGIYTAGQMQELMNLHGFVPEGPVVIVGSGDIGLILAQQLAEKGISVTIVEKRERCGGLAVNRRRLEGLPVRLICSDTVASVQGRPRITGCVTARGLRLSCRTLLTAAGLRPERELVCGLEACSWLWLCGNCRRVHPMVEAVILEGKQTGTRAYEVVRQTNH